MLPQAHRMLLPHGHPVLLLPQGHVLLPGHPVLLLHGHPVLLLQDHPLSHPLLPPRGLPVLLTHGHPVLLLHGLPRPTRRCCSESTCADVAAAPPSLAAPASDPLAALRSSCAARPRPWLPAAFSSGLSTLVPHFASLTLLPEVNLIVCVSGSESFTHCSCCCLHHALLHYACFCCCCCCCCCPC